MANPELIGYVDKLIIYPLKSGGRLLVNEAFVTRDGVQTVEGGLRDHDFMAVDAEPNQDGIHEFVQQRQRGMHIMTQIRPEYEAGTFSLTWAGNDRIEVPLDVVVGKALAVQVWDDVCIAVDQGDQLAKWLSEHLGKSVRLVRAVGSEFNRQARQTYVSNDNGMRFQDGYPIHWFPMASVRELEDKAGVELGWERFRPQMVAERFDAQTEHLIWLAMMADIPFDQPKPDERCPVPQINQDTGEKTAEPNRTLMQYKVWKNKRGEFNPIFGENANPRAEGIVRVGDRIEVLEFREEALVYGSYKDMKAA
jgi:uncharacterized protein